MESACATEGHGVASDLCYPCSPLSAPNPMPTPSSKKTISLEVFLQMVATCRAGKCMTPRSENDKEYFAQDWFTERLKDLGFPFKQQGRNSYPDFWVGSADDEGFEIKSLSLVGNRPARKDLDFNSTIPSGRKNDRDVFLVFFLYTGSGAHDRPVHTISVAHGDLINSDHGLADEHLNVAIKQFGSYADGFIRNRKMYVFPHPITIDPTSLGRQRLIVPRAWGLDDPRLKLVGSIERKVAPAAVDSYTIRLHGRGEADVQRVAYGNAGSVLRFDVFEAV